MLELVDKINFDELYDLLLDASRKAFREVQEAHPDETFYAFSLYYDFWNFIIPSCNSEETHMRLGNLTTAERDNQTLEWFYSRCRFYDWEYCFLGDEYFTSVSEWMKHNFYQLTGLETGATVEDMAVWTIVDNSIATICLKTFKVLDEEKLFGQGQARERVVLNVLNHKTVHEDDMNYVYLLNSISAYQRWWFEHEMQQHALSVLSPERFERNPD